MQYHLTLTVQRPFLWKAFEYEPGMIFADATVSLYQLLQLVQTGNCLLAMTTDGEADDVDGPKPETPPETPEVTPFAVKADPVPVADYAPSTKKSTK